MKGKVDLKQLSVAFKKYKYVALVLCVGVLLMLFPSGGKETLQTSDANKNETVFDLEELESKLANALSQINGVGEATVVLTLRTGGEEILAQDVSKGTSVEMQTVIVSTGGNGEAPVRIKTIYPEFQGALVICDGAGNSTVKLQVLQAVSAITGLSSDRISICQRK